MSTAEVRSKNMTAKATAAKMDMKFEIVVIPVSDIDRAKEFYGEKLGWRLDADYDNGKDFRVLQFTPPGSGCWPPGAPETPGGTAWRCRTCPPGPGPSSRRA